MVRSALIGLLAIAAVALAACGGEDAEPPVVSTTTPTITRSADGRNPVPGGGEDDRPARPDDDARDRFGGTAKVADHLVESVGGDREILVATIGDSLTAGAPFFDPDPRNRDFYIAGEPDERSQWQYWAARARPGTALRNCGLSGRRTDQIAGELERCAKGAGALVVQGGTNDLSAGVPPSRVADNIRAMVRRGRALGLTVLVAEVIPINNRIPGFPEAIRALNDAIATVAREEGATLVPWHPLLADAKTPSLLDLRYTVDGAHPTVSGHRILGRAAARALDEALG